ncbi:intercellular adhesion molecule 5-like [Ahaetulla prasina]|uniref:intercellular adhesion molecule 5-like n=1 Tax=Ahaetulla prasina TaxID=499056 RepID=UPI002648B53A|nr:intercellular adhesion molecule 5-like [Ahaetulla prasina]
MQRFFVFFLVALGSWAFEKGFAEENFVRIWPENPVVQFGGSLQINCSANTEADVIGLETAFRKEIIGTGSNWKVFRLSNISDWNSLPSLCFAEEHKATPAKTTITVYKSPTSIELGPVPEMEVGKQYNLICRVFGVAPIQNLTVTLLRGEEQLVVKTFEDHTQPEAGAVVVNHQIRAQQNDYNKMITCQTSLDLRPRGPLLKNTSHGISLWTFDFAKAPLLHTGLFLEAGTLMKVTCDAPEVSPAKEAMFDLWFSGKPLTFNTTATGGLASAQAVIASSSVGDHELICTVSLGPVTKNVTKMVNVFALPKPILQIGSSEAVVGQTVNITCSADGSASPGFKMQIRDGAKILASGNVDFLQHAMIAQQEDNEREFICQVTLTIDGHTKERSMSQKLTVFYGPQMDDSSCPQTWTWKEGSTTTLTCSALGNPTPTVQCWKDGRPYNIGKPQLIQIEHDGIYQCNATNQYGFDVRDVTIHVEPPQSIGHIIGYIVAGVVLIALLAGIAYWISYKQKIGIYRLWQQGKQRQSAQTAQNSVEQRFLNGKANV